MQYQTECTLGDGQTDELQSAICAREGGRVRPLWGA